ncbi:MAG: hypothetical protein ACLFV3_10555 [Phycisphaeraceae bacterium]
MTSTSDRSSRQPARARPRPPGLRALGRAEPPERLEIAGGEYRRQRVFKHDSFAATALYAGPAGQVVCKFNRRAPLLGLPMGWLGKRLGRREARALEALGDLPGIPAPLGPIRHGGRVLPYAVAHAFVEGHPMAEGEYPDDAFFARLAELLEQIHARGFAYVDLNKRDNILVGDDGWPYLIDFQIHAGLGRGWLGRVWPRQWLLKLLQECDRYHFYKHQLRHRPDLLPEGERDIERYRPACIRRWRLLATPFREGRRRLLVLLGVRRGEGRAESEAEPQRS